MIYRILLIFSFFLSACVNGTYQSDKTIIKETFAEKGFVLIYEESLKEDKILRKRIKNDELQVIHNKIKKNSFIDIFNPVNSKSLKAKVIAKDKYPSIYRLVVSKKIAELLELDLDNPYVEFSEIYELPDGRYDIKVEGINTFNIITLIYDDLYLKGKVIMMNNLKPEVEFSLNEKRQVMKYLTDYINSIAGLRGEWISDRKAPLDLDPLFTYGMSVLEIPNTEKQKILENVSLKAPLASTAVENKK